MILTEAQAIRVGLMEEADLVKWVVVGTEEAGKNQGKKITLEE